MEKKEIAFAPQLIGDLLDIIYNAIIVIDSNHTIIFANSRTASMFHGEIDELTGRQFHSIFTEEDTDIFVPNIMTITRRDKEFEGESMFKRLDGSTFLGLIAGTYFCWDNQQEAMAFTIHDISDMKTLERSLRQSERIAFLGRLVNDISHQIRNPVMVIGGFARRLQAGNSDAKHTRAIMDEAGRLESLLDTLNHFISLPRPEPARISLASVIEDVEGKLQMKVKSKGCLWQSDYETKIGDEMILVDKLLLFEALEAIVLNACESYDNQMEDKRVHFVLCHSDDPVCPIQMMVTDYGCGIKEESFSSVFAHFYTEKTRHIGMGLTFAQRIIEEQKGKISIESEVGVGTKVTFHLVKERRRQIRTKRIV